MNVVRKSVSVRLALAGSATISILGLWMLVSSDPANAVIQPIEWHRASIHGHEIHYATRGSGRALLLLHGGGDSGEHSFARQLDVFSERYHIVAPDQVGQGRTPDIPEPLTYTGMMNDTAALLRHLKLTHVDVVGFSDGGILALMLAVHHPELVRRLVISGVNIAPEGLNAGDLDELRATQKTKPKTISEKLAHLWLTSPTETELNLAMLEKIQQPVLVISGDLDAITLEHTLTIFRAL
ncbi:MAG: alpha/beta fold hydrolase, partial [Gammaproteobacteria bacterium]